MSNFSKSLKTGFKYIRRSRFLTISCVFSMTFSLFLSLAFVTMLVYSQFVLKGLENRAQMTVFFKPTTPENTILTLQKELTSRSVVERVNYVSQEDALKIYLGQHQNDPTLLESVSSSILPASLEIKTKSLSSLEPLASELRKRDDVDEAVFFKDVVDTFSRWSLILRITGLTLVVFMLLVSMIAVLLAVGVSVKIRADEIEIMRLVGATDSQVTWPFLWQGAVYGLISSIISFLLFILGIFFLYQFVKSLTPATIPVTEATSAMLGSLLIDKSIPLKDLLWAYAAVLGGHFILGPLLGTVSAVLGVKKYLKL